MRMLRGLAALVVLTVSVAVVPGVLVRLGRYPGPADLTWRRLWLVPDDGTVLLWLLTGLGWVLWALFTGSVVLETVALARSRPRVDLPGLRWCQSVAAGLLLAVLIMLGQGGSAEPGPAVVAARAAPLDPADLGDAERVSVEKRGGDDAERVEDGAAGTWRHTVRPGEDLWTLAEEHYGDGLAWRGIHALNRDLIGDTPDLLEVGWVLTMPGPDPGTPAPEPDRAVPPPREAPSEAPLSASATPAAVESPAAVQSPAAVESPASYGAVAGPEPATEAPVPTDVDSPDVDGHPALAGIGALLAVGLLGTLRRRRIRQLIARPFGTRPVPAGPAEARLRAALLAQEVDDPAGRTEWAVHMYVRDRVEEPLDPPERLIVHPDRVQLTWSDRAWEVTAEEVAADRAAHPDEPAVHPWPALVEVGEVTGPGGAAGGRLLVDLEHWGRVSVQADRRDRSTGILSAWLMSLATSPWGQDCRITVVGDDGGFAEECDLPQVGHVDELADILPEWQSRAAAQKAMVAAGHRSAVRLRLDPDLVDAWNPHVLVLLADITPAERRRLTDLFTRGPRGPLVLLTDHPVADATVLVDEDPLRAVLEPAGTEFVPAHVPAPTRDAVVALHRQTAPSALEPAPWIGVSHHPEEMEPMDTYPRLLLLGPIDLVGARGRLPARALRQCLEYCAYLLEHPGTTSVAMADALMVAEATRRSNMSRLRTWLGSGPAGEPYLPEAYSGRIRLHPGVHSDWTEVRILTGSGVPATSDASLETVLGLVRGAPLADAAPGTWVWAEELRLDMSCLIRDAAYELAGRRLTCGDLDGAKWALARGLAVAPGDELLLRRLMMAEHRSDNVREVERLVMTLNRQARTLGVDLADETVTTMQQVLEGGIRARLADRPRRAAV